MEFHPEFATNHMLFVTYTFTQGNQIKERLSSFTYNTSSEMLENEQILLNNINGYTTHIGSRILALEDLTILISTGDAQDQPASQDVNELTGKILRMDISEDNFGGVPSDNPIPDSMFGLGGIEMLKDSNWHLMELFTALSMGSHQMTN